LDDEGLGILPRRSHQPFLISLPTSVLSVPVEAYFLLVPLLAGASGLLHCLGMCGPFVAGYATTGNSHSHASLHFGYNSGRLIAYTTLGALFGFLGKIVDLSGELASIHAGAAFLGGGIMILYGLNNLGALKWLPWQFKGFKLKFHHSIVRNALTKPSIFSTFLLGLSTALLPCHLLLPMEAMAAGSGSPLKGAAILFTFGLGTLPAMTIYGIIAGTLKRELQKRLSLMTSLFMIGSGIVMIFYRW